MASLLKFCFVNPCIIHFKNTKIMSLKQKALHLAEGLLKTSINFVGGHRAKQILAQLSEDIIPVVSQKTDFGEIQFFCPGTLPIYRAQTLLTKEPDTIEWIDTFQKDDVLWDIGANVGVYSLYAAIKKLKVLAFEPSPSNYFILSRNIEINRMDDRISAYCIAFNDETKLDVFFMANTELGGALNSFGESIDFQGKPFLASLKQAMIGFSVDDFISQFNPPFPNHIKLDVDGIEDKIVNGFTETLADKRLKSVLVELDTEREEYCKKIVEVFDKFGLKLQKIEHATGSESSKFSYVLNHIFVRSL